VRTIDCVDIAGNLQASKRVKTSIVEELNGPLDNNATVECLTLSHTYHVPLDPLSNLYAFPRFRLSRRVVEALVR
jgi:hypothetical protein